MHFISLKTNLLSTACRSSRLQIFFKIGVGVVLESLLDKVVDLKSWNFIKRRLQHRSFPVNIAKFFRTAFSQNTSGNCFYVCHYPESFLFNMVPKSQTFSAIGEIIYIQKDHFYLQPNYRISKQQRNKITKILRCLRCFTLIYTY